MRFDVGLGHPSSGWTFLVGVGVCVAFGAVIAWGHSVQTSHAIAAPVVLDVEAAPCGRDRWETACARWEAAGWPSCTAGNAGIPVLELTPAMVALIPTGEVQGDDPLGAVVLLDDGRTAVALAATACDTVAPEHEIGHLYGLGHGWPTGTVMASPPASTGTRILRHGAHK